LLTQTHSHTHTHTHTKLHLHLLTHPQIFIQRAHSPLPKSTSINDIYYSPLTILILSKSFPLDDFPPSRLCNCSAILLTIVTGWMTGEFIHIWVGEKFTWQQRPFVRILRMSLFSWFFVESSKTCFRNNFSNARVWKMHIINFYLKFHSFIFSWIQRVNCSKKTAQKTDEIFFFCNWLKVIAKSFPSWQDYRTSVLKETFHNHFFQFIYYLIVHLSIYSVTQINRCFHQFIWQNVEKILNIRKK
jgi:hypothetical protein